MHKKYFSARLKPATSKWENAPEADTSCEATIGQTESDNRMPLMLKWTK